MKNLLKISSVIIVFILSFTLFKRIATFIGKKLKKRLA